MNHVTETADRILDKAKESKHGRHAELLVHEGPLRQALLALTEGTELEEHNSPPAAMSVVPSPVTRTAPWSRYRLAAGELHTLTHHRHSVTALADSVFLLTTVTSIPGQGSYDTEPVD